MSKKDNVAYSLQTLCHPASEFLADGQRLTLFIKRGNEAASEILRLRAENEKLRAALDDAAVELEFAHFASMNKRYKKAAKTARKAAALKETGDE